MRSFLRFFRHDESGNVLLLTGLAFLFLVGIGGAAYDLGKQQLVRQKLQQASDAAALAGAGREYGASDLERKDTANAFFALNYPSSYLDIGRPLPTISVVPDINVLVQAQADVPTSFVHTFNVNTLPSKGRSVAQIAVPQNKLDIVLVLDNSGSMANMDVGAASFLNAGPGIRPICIAGWIAYGFGPAANANAMCNIYEGAVGATRLNALRHSATQFTDKLMTPNPLDHQMAVVTWDYFFMQQLPFTNSSAPVKNFLLNMYGRGATNSTTGLQRAQLMIPSLRADTVRAVILMTDGENFPDFAGYNASSLAICDALKANPKTIVFTIAFGTFVNTSPAAQQFLSDCATGPNGAGTPKPNENLYYFPAPNAVALNTAFEKIVGILKKVRVLQ